MFRKTLKTAVGAFNKVCNLLLGIVMVAMFLVLLLQIISRFIAFIPLPWSQDFKMGGEPCAARTFLG